MQQTANANIAGGGQADDPPGGAATGAGGQAGATPGGAAAAGLTPTDVASAAAAVSAVIGVITSLAVTGVLAQAQRNHGEWLLIALGVVVFAATCWAVAALNPRAKAGRRRGLKLVALLAFGGGLIAAIGALVWTQKDSERPTVSATFNDKSRVLTGTATAIGVSTDDRLAVLVAGLNEGKPPDYDLQADPRSLYYAVVGPNASGNATHKLSVYVPNRYKLVGVKAWTGKNSTPCRTDETNTEIPQRQQSGCLVIRLPSQNSTNKRRSRAALRRKTTTTKKD
jgi:hypothetical protein